MLIAKYRNEKAGIEGQVVQLHGSGKCFLSILLDVDSMKHVPGGLLFENLEDAMSDAKYNAFNDTIPDGTFMNL